MNTVLVPTDLSPASQNATSYAGRLCKELGARMILLHVYMLPVPVAEMPYIMVTPDEMQKASEDALRKEADRIFDSLGIEIQPMVRMGLASDEIRDIEIEQSIDLVVVGMKGGGQLDQIIGSTTSAVIRKSHKAVLVVPSVARFTAIQSVCYATDFSYQMKLDCFQSLKVLVSHFKARLSVVYIQKTGKTMSADQIAGKERLEPVLSGFDHSHHMVEANDIEHGLQQFIEAESPDMLVMVVHKHNIFERLFGTHHTMTMMYQIQIPLLVLQDK